MGLWKRILFENREVPNAILTKSYLWWRIKLAAWGKAPRSQTVDLRRFEGTTLHSQTCRPLQINVLCFFETLVTDCLVTRRHIAEARSHQPRGCENFKTLACSGFKFVCLWQWTVRQNCPSNVSIFVFFSSLESGRLKVSFMKQQIGPTQLPTVLQETDRQTDRQHWTDHQ